MEESRSRATGGRPPACEIAARRQHLISIASALFVSKGYEATSLENIAKEAGASKTTIYRNFGDKAGLFRSLVNRFIEPIWPQFDGMPVEGKTPREVMTSFGVMVLSPAVLNAESVALLRLVYQEAPRFPELARIFREAEDRTTGGVAKYLQSAAARGLLRIQDPTRSASQFLEMVWGQVSRQLVLGIATFPDEAERRTIIDTAVSLFLDGTATDRSRP